MTRTDPPSIHPPNHFLIQEASWRLYQSFIREIGDSNVRVTYSQGRMELRSPPPQHERDKKLIAQLLELMTFERNIARGSLGSTTYSDEVLDRGLKPDECYYIANEARVRGKDRIDFSIDPPPDLAIEIDISYRAIDREPIYAAMKVPEVWRYDGEKLECLMPQSEGRYALSTHGRSFPFLPVGELKRFIDMIPGVDENTMLRAFREWIRTLPA